MSQLFQAGEEMSMHDFLERFKRAYCGGIEPRFWQSTVKFLVADDAGVMISIRPKEKEPA